jgi:hypothetical protein
MWILIIVIVALAIATYELTPGPPKQSPGQINTPTASQGISIAVLFGTREIAQPNVVWYGDIDTVAVKASGGKK